MKFIIGIIRRLACRWDFVFVAHTKTHMGAVVFEVEEGNEEHISKILASAMEAKPEIRGAILEAAKIHLKKYEIDCRNFCKEVYNK